MHPADCGLRLNLPRLLVKAWIVLGWRHYRSFDGGIDTRALQCFTESLKRSSLLFLRNSGRKTATHFSWSCSSRR
ncbi:hypothetical protein EXN69_13985 [Rhizobium rhizogenes]|nr:hypothetical protein FFE80_19250 [Rhizobium rhizogenes]TRB57230.1 hypothetical protein EXN69_13985 [Rhizobium rhizogenes]